MKYTTENGIHIVESPVSDFKIVMCDKVKKTASARNYINAGFFAAYKEDGKTFTLPVAHIVCDYSASSQLTKKYCTERGNFIGNKFSFDSNNWSYPNQFYGKAISSLIIDGGKANIQDIKTLPSLSDYAISGIPVMRNGGDVTFASYVVNQGWDSSSLYATWHTFVGLKNKDASTIYIFGMKTTSANMIKSAESYKKFKALGLIDVIKLDGGGSFYMNINGKSVASTSENRQINNIILFGGSTTSDPTKNVNPFNVPTISLRKGSTGSGVKWLQWQLNYLGYNCGTVDGVFGNNTCIQVKAFQVAKDLEADGIVGAKTRAILI